jgi:hypothetical protein
MNKAEIYELIKILLKEDVFFSYDNQKQEYILYDDIYDIKIYDKDLGNAIKKFIRETVGKYSNNFVNKLYKMAKL